MYQEQIKILTYDVDFHQKTYDVLCLLKARGYNDVIVFAKPLHYEKKTLPLIFHRPQDFSCCFSGLSLKNICKNFNYEYKRIDDYETDIMADINYTGGGIFSVRCWHTFSKIYNNK